MGIKGLTTLLQDICPNAIKEDKLQNYFGRKVAIDASTSIYQFMISIRGAYGGDLTNEKGEVTSHLQGMFYRTIRLLEAGLKPIFVFDGKPPEMKSGELQKRKEKAKKAQEEMAEAREEGDEERMNMFSKRTIRVTKEQTDECKKLLSLMGIPYIEAPSEAEAQCAEMCKGGLVYATGTEDMDALTFGTKILLRHLTFSEAKKMPVQEFHLESVLNGLDVTMDQFIDICILCGCDYCDSIRGIGPKKALSMIKKYKNIEGVLEHIKGMKQFVVPENFPYEEVRKLFKNPEVIPAKDIKITFKDVDEEGLLKFLFEEKQFNEEKVKNAIKRIKATKNKATQVRLDSYFKVIKRPSTSKPATPKKGAKGGKKEGTKKRKRDDTKESSKKKMKK